MIIQILPGEACVARPTLATLQETVEAVECYLCPLSIAPFSKQLLKPQLQPQDNLRDLVII